MREKMRGGRVFFIMHVEKKVTMSRKYNVNNKVDLLLLGILRW